MQSRFFSGARSIVTRALIALTVLQSFAFSVPTTMAAQQAGTIVHPMISAGNFHTLSLKSDGTVWTWGSNANGQLGDGGNTNSNVPVQVAGLTGVVAVSGGSQFSLALKSDGTVWAWGFNFYGLGDGVNSSSNSPVQVTGISGVVAIDAAENHSVALESDGTVWAWGANGAGQLGDATNSNSPTPVQVTVISNVTAISAGGNTSTAIEADGTVWAWGSGFIGQLGDGANSDSNFPVQTSGITTAKAIATGNQFSIALLADGTVRSWGSGSSGQLGNASNSNSSTPVTVSGLSNVTDISAGSTHAVARKADGTVQDWGAGGNGNLGNGVNSNSNVPVAASGLTGAAYVAAGLGHTVALMSNGDVWAWGYNSDGEIGNGSNSGSNVPVQSTINLYVGPAGIIAISNGGGSHTLALKNDGHVWAWGYNVYGELGDGSTTTSNVPVEVTGLTNVIAIASSGADHSLALKDDGTVWAWGWNQNGMLGNGTMVDSPTPVQVTGLTNVAAIGAGSNQSIALKADGTVWTWGYNGDGQLGNGDAPNDSLVPVQVTGLTDMTAIASGALHLLALKADGTVRAWGFGGDGELGNGASVSSDLPVTVLGLTNAKSVSGGGYHSAALLADGTVMTWGRNNWGQLGDGNLGTDTNSPAAVPGLSDVSFLSSAGGNSFALKNDGTVWSWGYNGLSMLGNGNTGTDSDVPVQVHGPLNVGFLSGMKTVSGSIALKNDGTVWSWGYNAEGELGNGNFTDSNVPVQVLFAAPPPPPGPSTNTTSNRVLMSRLQMGAPANVAVSFDLTDTLSSDLIITFAGAFTDLDVSSAVATTPSAPGCIGTISLSGPNEITATKTNCTGPIMISDITVTNPATPGSYLVSWVNDDPGYSLVAIVDSDQVTVNAQVSPSITFDLDTGIAAGETAAPYSVALGALTTAAVNHSDNTGINSIFAQLDTNATSGAQVTVLSANAALESTSVPADTIPNSAASMAAGTANYGICVNTVTPPTFADGTFQASAPYNAGTCDPAGDTNAVQALDTVTPTNILDSASAPVTTGAAEILVNAAIDTSTVAHSDYTDTLTFVATGTF